MTQHDRILNDVRANILTGVWQPGFRIPFETELASHYGVSRMTVNKVLTQLTRAGLLQRRRKSGTVVCLPRVQSAVMEITDIERDITRLGRRYSYRLLSREVRPATPDDGLGEARLLALTCLHCADSLPYCHEDRLINLAAVPEAEGRDFTAEGAGGWLLRTTPWSGAEHRVSAIGAGRALAGALQITPGTACLVVDRRTEFSGTGVTRVQLCYPGNLHQMVARFSPQSD
ncbi:UTRA domain-containing protein [Paracoccaceae bacterium Fryx2]|nr:UTRA domain-containing protein [Paracoccaceae bacterium Fryx2]